MTRVQACAKCGEENPPRFRLCGFCGAPLVQALPTQEVRKTVTIVFSDLQGSTSLGEKLDSESLREVLSRYFEVMRAVLEEHGGTIEKYIGDAIMAVFGLPRVHEDDALRAVMAAAEMQRALETLNDELERRWGVRLVNRTGVNTGEVIAGDPRTGQRLVSGDPVNVAARLEQAAPALQTLIGESTYRLVRDTVDVERVEPLELKGKAERVQAYRLMGAKDYGQRLGRPRTSMVGRQAELTTLLVAMQAAVDAEAARVVTVVGDPGIGKTRLLEELTTEAASTAMVLRGRCLSYGRGITFWPLVEVVRHAAGIRSDDPPNIACTKLDLLLEDADEVSLRVASAIGISDQVFPLQEIYWGTRKLFETLARSRPLVVILEDVHWAEPAFLDLIEYVAQHTAAGMLIVCAARPDLLEARPAWGQHADWQRLTLQPLGNDDSALLVANVLGDAGLPVHVLNRVVSEAEGNPLFVEQLLSMLIEEGLISREPNGWRVTRDLSELAVPSSIEALLAARLELLTDEERALLEPASVVGLMFREDALEELIADALRSQTHRLLEQLVRKRLVQPDASDPSGRWYRFQHILIRDTAYRRLLKRTRAVLHERFANWGERVNQDRDGAVEYEEIHGYHLEQAHRYLSELGPLDARGQTLGARASEHLGAAGQRAFERGDMRAAANLLGRAAALLPQRAPERVALLPELGEAMMETGELAAAEALLDEALTIATALGAEQLEADVLLSRLFLRVRGSGAKDLGQWRKDVERETARLIPMLEQRKADAELAKAWRLLTGVHGTVCQWEKAAEADERGIWHARSAGRRRDEARIAAALAQAVRNGPTPVPEAIRRCKKILADGLVDQQAEATATLALAYLQALAGDLAAARWLYKQAQDRLSDLGGGLIASRTSFTSGRVELLADDTAAAEAELRRDYDALGERGERYFRPVIGALLAQTLYTAQRHDEAFVLTGAVEEMAAGDDVEAQVLWRCVRAKVVALKGHIDEALCLTERALMFVETTDAPVLHGDTLIDRATVLLHARRQSEAVEALQSARESYMVKSAIVSLGRVDRLLASLHMDAPPPLVSRRRSSTLRSA